MPWNNCLFFGEIEEVITQILKLGIWTVVFLKPFEFTSVGAFALFAKSKLQGDCLISEEEEEFGWQNMLVTF